MLFRLSKTYYVNGKLYIRPKYPHQTYKTNDQDEIKFLKERGHEILDDGKPKPSPIEQPVEAPEDSTDSLLSDLSNKKYNELQKLAAELGIKKTANVRKKDLIKMITENLE